MTSTAAKLLAAGFVTVTLMADTALGAYAPGFTWNRATDWANDTSASGHAANPTLDAESNGAWSYYWLDNNAIKNGVNPNLNPAESVISWPPTGTNPVTVKVSDSTVWTQDEYALGGSSAWYRRLGGNTDTVLGSTYATMTSWNGTVYRRATNSFVTIGGTAITANAGGWDQGYRRQAIIEWANPTGQNLNLEITGNLVLTKNSSTSTLDYVIAHYDGTSWTELLTGTLTRSDANSLSVPVNALVTFGAGDILAISARAVGTTSSLTYNGSSWSYSGNSADYTLTDNLVLTIIPEPASLGLFLLGLGLVMRRRGRK